MSISTYTCTYHVSVFDGTGDHEFTFDSETIADAFVRGLLSCDSYMVTYHECAVLASGEAVWTEFDLPQH